MGVLRSRFNKGWKFALYERCHHAIRLSYPPPFLDIWIVSVRLLSGKLVRNYWAGAPNCPKSVPKSQNLCVLCVSWSGNTDLIWYDLKSIYKLKTSSCAKSWSPCPELLGSCPKLPKIALKCAERVPETLCIVCLKSYWTNLKWFKVHNMKVYNPYLCNVIVTLPRTIGQVPKIVFKLLVEK